MSGPVVASMPAAKFQVAWPTRLVQYQVRARTSAQPVARSLRRDYLGTCTGLTLISAKVHALTPKVAASSTNAQPAPTVETGTPANAGPARFVALPAMPMSELAAWRPSSTVVPATSGKVAGVSNADAAPLTAAAIAMRGKSMCPASSDRPMDNWAVPDTTAAAIATRRGLRRSTTTPPIGSNATFGSSAHTRTTARPADEWVAMTIASVRAAGLTASPSW